MDEAHVFLNFVGGAAEHNPYSDYSIHEEFLPIPGDVRTVVYDETAITSDWTLRGSSRSSYRYTNEDEMESTRNLHAYFIPSVSFLCGARYSPEAETAFGVVGSANGLFTIDLGGSLTYFQLGAKIGTDVGYVSADDSVELLPSVSVSLLILRNSDFIEHCGYLVPGALNNGLLCIRQDKYIFSAGSVFRYALVGNDSDIDYGWQLEASFIPYFFEYLGLHISFRHYPEVGDYEVNLGLLSMI